METLIKLGSLVNARMNRSQMSVIMGTQQKAHKVRNVISEKIVCWPEHCPLATKRRVCGELVYGD